MTDIDKVAVRLACHADCEWQYMTEERRNSFREIVRDIITYLGVLGYKKVKEVELPDNPYTGIVHQVYYQAQQDILKLTGGKLWRVV